MMRWKLWLSAAVLLGFSSIGAQQLRSNHNDIDTRYSTVLVDRGPIAERVNANGTLSALITVQVGSQISGRIRDIQVDFNSKVKKGQVLATLDPALLKAAEAQARAHQSATVGELAKANANVHITGTKLKRSRELADKKLIAEADLDQAIADAESARAQADAALANVAEANAALQQCQVNLTYTTIRSPVDGVVISRAIDVGQTVAASLQAPTLFTIAGDLAKMQVDTSIAEADVGKVKPHMRATFIVDAYPSLAFRGVVREVRNAPQMVQNVVTYDAVIDVDNPELRLKPGMTAHVSFVYTEKPDVVRLANRALRYRANVETRRAAAARAHEAPLEAAPLKANERELYVLDAHGPRRVRVRVGITDGTKTELVGTPLQPGDRVIVGLREDNADRASADNPNPKGFF